MRSTIGRMIVSICYDGLPVPLARHRTTKSGHRYTPGPSTAFMDRIGWLALAATAKVPGWDRDGRFSVNITLGDVRRTYDIDNVAKAVLDALTKVKCVWVDDRRVEQLHISRVSADPPYVRVDVRPHPERTGP